MPSTCGIHAEHTPNGSFADLDPERLPMTGLGKEELLRFGTWLP